jgi:hypothetical protein
MTIAKHQARKLAESILREHDTGSSYRQIAASYPRRPDGSQIVKAGTINRIANEMGEWLPKDPEILVALGLKKEKPRASQHELRTRKIIRRMVRKTNDAVIRRKA